MFAMKRSIFVKTNSPVCFAFALKAMSKGEQSKTSNLLHSESYFWKWEHMLCVDSVTEGCEKTTNDSSDTSTKCREDKGATQRTRSLTESNSSLFKLWQAHISYDGQKKL